MKETQKPVKLSRDYLFIYLWFMEFQLFSNLKFPSYFSAGGSKPK